MALSLRHRGWRSRTVRVHVGVVRDRQPAYARDESRDLSSNLQPFAPRRSPSIPHRLLHLFSLGGVRSVGSKSLEESIKKLQSQQITKKTGLRHSCPDGL